MNTLLALIILFFIVAYGHKEYMQAKLKCSPANAPRAVILALAQYLRDTPSHKNIIDLGSGWGKTIYTLADLLPRARIFGIELSFTPWLVSHLRSIGSKVTNVRLLKEDFYETDLRLYDVVYANLPANTLKRLAPLLEHQLSEGSIVVSYNTDIPGWKKSNEIDTLAHDKKNLFIYIIGEHKEEISEENPTHNENTESAIAHSEKTAPGPSTSKNENILANKQFKPGMILGHRGTGVTMYETKEEAELRRREGTKFPENTYEACMRALQKGANGIEIDVLKTKDNELVVCHDDNLNLHVVGADRHKTDWGFISEKTYDEIRHYNIGDGLRIPLLDDILHLVKKYKAILNIEAKSANMADLLVNTIQKYSDTIGLDKDNILVSSFDHALLKNIRTRDSALKLGMLFAPNDEPTDPIYENDPTSPSYRHFSMEYVDKAMQIIHPSSLHILSSDLNEDVSNCIADHGLSVFLWTRDEPRLTENRDLISMFYHFRHEGYPAHLITDYPEQVVEFFKDTDSSL